MSEPTLADVKRECEKHWPWCDGKRLVHEPTVHYEYGEPCRICRKWGKQGEFSYSYKCRVHRTPPCKLDIPAITAALEEHDDRP